jgi:hypothetical protein
MLELPKDLTDYAPKPKQEGALEWAPEPPDLDRIGKWSQDPLKVVAENLRGLTLEQITRMANDMGEPNIRDTLVQWAIAYLDGGHLPLKEPIRRV